MVGHPKNRPTRGLGLFDFWGKIFLQKAGEPYSFVWGKEGRLVKNLLKVHGLPRLQSLISQFFRDEQCKRRGFTIGIFQQEITRLVTLKAMDPLEQARRELQDKPVD